MMIPDNYDLWERHDAEQEARAEELPECYYCGKRIYDEYAWEINDEWVCTDCLVKHHRKEVIT